MTDQNSISYSLWRNRDLLLKKENISPWDAARIRRENVNQLCYEFGAKELEFETFSHLVNEEIGSYSRVVDEKDKTKGLNSYQDEVAKLVPNYKENLKKCTGSKFTTDRLMKMDCVKNALEQCKIIKKAEKDELERFGDLKLPMYPKTNKKLGTSETGTSKSSKRVSIPGSSGIPKEKLKKFSVYDKSKNDFEIVQENNQKHFEDISRKNKRKFSAPAVDNDSSGTEDNVPEPERKFHFKSAREQFEIDKKKNKNRSPQVENKGSNANSKKSLGARPRNNCFGKFVPPSNKDQKEQDEREGSLLRKCGQKIGNDVDMEEDIDPRLKGIEPKIIELVTNEIMDHGPPIQWDDIAGLEFAKTTIKEIVIWPMLRPDIFTGLRGPPKGILLFGPPGTGKTLIGKCIASQSGATFFSISASSLTSKWVGEGEKMVRALFAVASCHQPAVIFIDEIDSLLSQRCDSEHESSRRIKTEFLVQLDGAATSSEDRILVVGATNRPQEIDEAARRRLSKRLYIPLPEGSARKQIVESLLQQQSFQLNSEEIDEIISKTDGYSGADMANLCREAALGPIRSLQGMDISKINKDDVRSIILEDFQKALLRVRPSVSSKDLVLFEDWNKQYGCCSF